MPEEQAQTVEQETRLVLDPMREIIESDAQRFAAELGTVLDEEETQEETSETSEEPSETENKSKANGKTSESRSTDTSSKRNLGTDEFLKQADASDNPLLKEAARLVRSGQATTTKVQTQYKQYQKEFADLAKTVEQLKTGQDKTKEEDPDDPLNQLEPERVELFSRLAEKLGFVRKEDLDRKEVEDSAFNFKQGQAKKLLDQYPDAGSLDDEGKFRFHEEVLPGVTEVFERWYDEKRGVTPEDLYFAAMKDDILKSEYERGKADALKEAQTKTSQKQDRVNGLRKAITETRSTSGVARDHIYDPSKKEPVDVVIARAMAAAMRELSVK